MSGTVKIEPNWQEKFILEIANIYRNNMELIEKLLSYSQPLVICFIDVYGYFLGKGLVKIENLDEETKQALYRHSVVIRPEGLRDGERRNLCRCIWLLNHVFEKYFV